MAYTPPSYSAVDFTWQGEAAYSPPANNAGDFSFSPSGSGIATTTGASTVLATSQTLYAHGVGASAVAAIAVAVGGLIAQVSGTATGTSTTSGALQGVKEIVGASAGVATTSFKIGNLQGAVAAATGDTSVTGISSVEARAVVAAGLATSSVVGAWDGASGGDGVTTTAPIASATGRAFALVQATATAGSATTGVIVAIATTVGSAEAGSTATAETARVLPMYGNGIMQWYDQSVAEGVSEVVGGLVVRAGTGLSDCMWLTEARMFSEGIVESVATAAAALAVDGRAAISGDAVAASIGTATAEATGVEDLYAASVGEIQVRAFVRAYSADGRQNKGVSVAASTAAGVSDYSIAPHYVTGYFESAALAQLYGTTSTISESIGAVFVTSRAYSFRGEVYDEASIKRLHVNKLSSDVWVYIGDYHGG
jgi:hypothetical protein